MASWTVDRATGRVAIRAYAGVDKRTRRKRNLYASLPAGATDAEILAACAELDAKAAKAKELGVGTDMDSVVDMYLSACKAAGYAPSTLQSYESDYRRHVRPYVGTSPVSALRPWDMSVMFEELADAGRVDGTGLAKASMSKLYSWLNACLKWAVGMGFSPSNPMEGVKRVYPGSVEAEPISEFDLGAIYRWLAGQSDDWEGLTLRRIVQLGLGTGLRRGEVSGLFVEDLHLATSEVSVRRSATEVGGFHYKMPKSKTSVRKVSVNEGTVRDLQAYLHAQRDILEEGGKSQVAKGPLFCHEDGSPWRPSELTAAFGDLRKSLGLDSSVHFHSMRHTHASILLASGCDIRTLQERLGHSSVNTTLRIYGHVLPGRDRAAAELWGGNEERLRGGG